MKTFPDPDSAPAFSIHFEVPTYPSGVFKDFGIRFSIVSGLAYCGHIQVWQAWVQSLPCLVNIRGIFPTHFDRALHIDWLR